MGKLLELVGLQSKTDSLPKPPENGENSGKTYIKIEGALPEPVTYQMAAEEDCLSCKAISVTMFLGVGSYVLYESLQKAKKLQGMKRTGCLAFGISTFIAGIGLSVARVKSRPRADK